MYRVEFTEQAKKEVKKLDPQTSKLILSWIRKNLEGCENPRQHGKSLTGKHKDKWRYRIGKYRLLSNIDDKKIVIILLAVGHRGDIYK